MESPQTTSRTHRGRHRKQRSPEFQVPDVPSSKPSSPRWLINGYYPVLILAATAITSIRLVAEPDCWFHMAFGRFVLQNGAFPPGDVFSHTGHGKEWISTGWAPSLIMHSLYQQFGCTGLLVMVLAVTSGALLALYFVATRYFGNNGSAALVLLAAILAAHIRFTPRPEIFSICGIAVLILLLVTAEHSSRMREGKVPWQLWLLPLLFVFWANMHGEFLVGLAPVLLYGGWHLLLWFRTKHSIHLRLLVPLSITCLAWLLNPYGAGPLKLVFQVSGTPTVNLNLCEYLPLYSTNQKNLPWPTYLGFGLFVCAVAYIVSREWKSISLWQKAILAVFLAMTLIERRHLGIGVLAMAATLTPHIPSCRSKALQRALPVAATTLLLIIAGLKQTGAMEVGGGLFTGGLDTKVLPEFAVDFLKKNRPPDNMFNTYGPGGYILYHLGPETKVFIDGRFFVYDNRVWEDFLATENGSADIDALCQRYGIKTFFIYIGENSYSPTHLASRLASRPDFCPVYFDDTYAVFVRDLPETRAYLAAHAYRFLNPYNPALTTSALASPSKHAVVLAELDRALKHSHNSVPATALAVMAYRQLNQSQRAEEILSVSLKLHPHSSVLRRLGASPPTR